MKRFTIGNLTLELDADSARRSVVWTGEIDVPNPAEGLTPVLEEILGKLQGGDVDLRFDTLRYMNSASLTPIMAFLRDLSATAKHVTVRYRSDLQWQSTSFRAMRVVARKWPNVEVVSI